MKLRIDWSNHLLSFLSSLIGIFIAFQLDDWATNRSKSETTENTLKTIKLEIENNLSIYDANISKIDDLLEYVDYFMSHNQEGGLISTQADLDLIFAKNKERFKDLKFINKYNDSLNVYHATLIIDFVPTTGISSNNWEAAKSAGLLGFIDHTKASTLTLVYDWINKDLGFDDAAFYTNMIQNSDGSFINIDKLIDDYRKILKVYKLKKSKVKENYITIDWDIK